MTDFSRFPLIQDALIKSHPSESEPQTESKSAPAYQSFNMLSRLAKNGSSTDFNGNVEEGRQENSFIQSKPSLSPECAEQRPPDDKTKKNKGGTENAVWKQKPLQELFEFLGGANVGASLSEPPLRDIFK